MASLSEEQQEKLSRASGIPPINNGNGRPLRPRGSAPSMQALVAQAADEPSRRSIKPKSSSARLVYRVLLLTPDNRVEGVVQVISDPIRCSELIGLFV